MTFREWNNRKNNWLRAQKGEWAAKLLGGIYPLFCDGRISLANIVRTKIAGQTIRFVFGFGRKTDARVTCLFKSFTTALVIWI